MMGTSPGGAAGADLEEQGLHSLHAVRPGCEQERVERILSLPDASMLRAVRLSCVLRCGGELLSDRKGSEATFGLSEPVARIDAFVSHNWATPRWLKFLALALHFNGGPAALAAIACLCVCTALTLAGLGPFVDGDAPTGILALPCTLPTYFAVLLLRGELGGPLGCGGRMVFLDKVCIDQSSDAAKEKGIRSETRRSLAAFLGKSESMVVCYSSLYLQRLWTVYELGTYLQILQRGEATRRVYVLPVGLSACTVICSVLLFLALMAVRALVWLQLCNPGRAGVVIPAAACLGLLTRPLRVWARQQRQAQVTAAGFSLENAHCCFEEDRALVKANSVALLKSYGFTAHDASEEEALAVFDRLVRATTLQTLTTCLGRLGYPYRQLLPLILALLSVAVDVIVGAERARAVRPRPDLPCTPLLVATGLASSFGTLPLALGVMLLLSRRRLHLRGLCELAYCCCMAVSGSVAVLFDPWRGGVSLLVPLARTSRFVLAGIFVWCAALLIAAAWLFRPTPGPKRRSTTAAQRQPGSAAPWTPVPEHTGEPVLEHSQPVPEDSLGPPWRELHDPASLLSAHGVGQLAAL